MSVASAYFSRLADQPDLPAPAQAAIGVPTVELVRALLTTRTGAQRLARESLANSLVERILTYARMHLADPGLTPQRIAAAQHISVRHLYAVLADAEISLATWIRTQRLEACRVELSRPLQHQVPIAGIAARWGSSTPPTSVAPFGPSSAYRRASGVNTVRPATTEAARSSQHHAGGREA